MSCNEVTLTRWSPWNGIRGRVNTFPTGSTRRCPWPSAQGRTLGVTSALGIACAQILHPGLLPADLSVSAALEVRLADDRLELIGPAGTDLAEKVLVDAPGLGLGLVEARWLSPGERGPGPFDPEVAVRRVCSISAFEVVAGPGQSDERRVAATNLARLFMSTEILGARVST